MSNQKTIICSICRKELLATSEYFYHGKDGHNYGFSYKCIKCEKDYKKIRQEQIAKNNRIYSKKNYKRRLSLKKIHWKVNKLKVKQKYCSICNEEKKLELSNIEGKYSENVNDYWWLCHECHALYDRTNKTHKVMA